MEQWDPVFADRRQELVFIGAALDERPSAPPSTPASRRWTRFAPEDWTGLPDPFPAWGARAAA
jgi:hypothetical protein